LVPGIGALMAVPLFAWAVMSPHWGCAVTLLSLAGFLFYTSLGPTFGVVQNVVGSRQRATATAFLYICLNVVALGGGPWFTGAMIDRFAERDFPAAQIGAERSFKAACPGGHAPAASPAALSGACKATQARATRQGMLIALIFFAWGGIHYCLAAIGMARALRAPPPRVSRAR